jgi:hypothetical protein
MIGIEECESDGQVIAQLDFGRGVKGERSLAQLLMINSRIEGNTPASPAQQKSRVYHPSQVELSNVRTF